MRPVMNATERRLYQAWFHHYARGDARRVAATLSDSLDEGVDHDAILDEAAQKSERMRERAYRRRLARDSRERAAKNV